MLRRLSFLVALVATIANGVAAQTIRGVVVDDSTDQALESVLLTLIDPDGKEVSPGSRSNDGGGFILQAPSGGRWQVRAVRIGYARVTSAPVAVKTAEVVTMRIAMSPASQRVDPVTVTDRRRYSIGELMSTHGFELRRTQPGGTFYTAEELARFGAFEDIARAGRTPTLRVSGRAGDRVLSMRVQGGNCLPWLYLDGAPIYALVLGEPLDFRANRASSALGQLNGLPMDQLYGVEVYRYPQQPPLALAGTFSDPQNTCGWIAVWTASQRNRDARGDLGDSPGTSPAGPAAPPPRPPSSPSGSSFQSFQT